MKNLKNFLDKSVDEVKKVHKSISKVTFDTLEKVDPIKKQVNTVKNVHDTIVDKTYETIHEVNGKLNIADDKKPVE